MDLKLKGKRAFVSGSTAGIGFAVALGLAREGAEVAVNGRTDTKVSDTIKRIAGGTAATVSGIAADLGSAAGVDRLLSELGKVDILVNNIGIFEPKPFLEIPDADWLRFFETNVMSGVRLSRSLLPYMIERGWGRIVFISSESGLNIPDRDGALRHDQDSPTCHLPRHRRERGRDRSYGECGAARANAVGRRHRVSREDR